MTFKYRITHAHSHTHTQFTDRAGVANALALAHKVNTLCSLAPIQLIYLVFME